jgi:ABC-type arginine transport system permease subunit
MIITYSESVCVALVVQHAKRMRRIILPSVVCLAIPNFST